MLNILCCVKQVPDVNQMRMDPETGSLIRAGVPSMLNPQDSNALSAALKIKETYGGQVTVISMGPPAAEAVLAVTACVVLSRFFRRAEREAGGVAERIKG